MMKQYTGTPFVHGSTDCYGLVRDFYKTEFDIDLTNYARPDGWWDSGMDLYRDHFEAEGFSVADIPLREVQYGDLFLIAIQSSVPNHAAIYVGDNKILHHYYNRLSEIIQYKGIWRNQTTMIIRHDEVTPQDVERDHIDIIELLPESKRKQLEWIISENSIQIPDQSDVE